MVDIETDWYSMYTLILPIYTCMTTQISLCDVDLYMYIKPMPHLLWGRGRCFRVQGFPNCTQTSLQVNTLGWLQILHRLIITSLDRVIHFRHILSVINNVKIFKFIFIPIILIMNQIQVNKYTYNSKLIPITKLLFRMAKRILCLGKKLKLMAWMKSGRDIKFKDVKGSQLYVFRKFITENLPIALGVV